MLHTIKVSRQLTENSKFPAAQPVMQEINRVGSGIAERYTGAIITYCEELRMFGIGAIAGMTFARACALRIAASG